jgi:hypothetical protein
MKSDGDRLDKRALRVRKSFGQLEAFVLTRYRILREGLAAHAHVGAPQRLSGQAIGASAASHDRQRRDAVADSDAIDSGA